MRLLLHSACLCICSLHLSPCAAIYRNIVSIIGVFFLVLICLAGVFIASFLAVARPMCKVRDVMQDVLLLRTGSIGACCVQYVLCLYFGAPAAKMPPAQSVACTARHSCSTSLHKPPCLCQAIEKSAEAMERAAQATETSAQEVEKAAIMLQMDAPSLLDSLEASIQVRPLLMLLSAVARKPEGDLLEAVRGHIWVV